MDIFITVKNVYGKDVIYPHCDKAKLFAKLLGQIILTEKNVRIIKELGFNVRICPTVTKLKI